VVRFASIASQAFSASANVLKGDPPILMAVRLRLMRRQEATKPGRPWSPGPLLLSLLITNEKPRSLAIHISNSSVAGAMRLKCWAIPRSSEPETAPGHTSGAANLGTGFLPARGNGDRAGSGDSTRRRAPGSSDCNIFPTVARAGLTKKKRSGAIELPSSRGLRVSKDHVP